MGAFEVNLALLAVTAFGGAVIRSHWPKVWSFLAPVFGAAQSVASQSVGIAPQPAPLAMEGRPLRRPPYGGWTVDEVEGFYRAMRNELREMVEDERPKTRPLYENTATAAICGQVNPETTGPRLYEEPTTPDKPS